MNLRFVSTDGIMHGAGSCWSGKLDDQEKSRLYKLFFFHTFMDCIIAYANTLKVEKVAIKHLNRRLPKIISFLVQGDSYSSDDSFGLVKRLGMI